MRLFVPLATRVDRDEFEAWAWSLAYAEALAWWQAAAEHPLTNGVGVIRAPVEGDPVDYDTGLRRFIWVTQRCPTIVVQDVEGLPGQSLAVYTPAASGLGDAPAWALQARQAHLPEPSVLASVRDDPDDPAGSRARVRLGIDAPRRRMVTVSRGVFLTEAEVLAGAEGALVDAVGAAVGRGSPIVVPPGLR